MLRRSCRIEDPWGDWARTDQIQHNKCTAPEDTETINLPRWRTERRAHLLDLAELRDGFLGGGGPRRGPPSRSSATREGRERGPLDGGNPQRGRRAGSGRDSRRSPRRAQTRRRPAPWGPAVHARLRHAWHAHRLVLCDLGSILEPRIGQWLCLPLVAEIARNVISGLERSSRATHCLRWT